VGACLAQRRIGGGTYIATGTEEVGRYYLMQVVSSVLASSLKTKSTPIVGSLHPLLSVDTGCRVETC
jgi:hypothetical protein